MNTEFNSLSSLSSFDAIMNTEFNSLSSLSSFDAMMNTEFNSLSISSTVNNAIESNQMKKIIEEEIKKRVMEKYETSD